MAKKPRAAPPAKPPKTTRFQIESPTRGIYVGAPYEQRTRDWPLFSGSPSEDRIIRFDDRQAAEAELVYVRGYAANARLREVECCHPTSHPSRPIP